MTDFLQCLRAISRVATLVPDSVLWGALVSLSATYLGVQLKSSNDSRREERKAAKDAMDDFLFVIDPLISKLEKIHARTSPKAAYYETLGELKHAASILRNNTSRSARVGFDETWQQYEGIERKLLEPELVKLQNGCVGVDYRRGIGAILPLLRKLKSYTEN